MYKKLRKVYRRNRGICVVDAAFSAKAAKYMIKTKKSDERLNGIEKRIRRDAIS